MELLLWKYKQRLADEFDIPSFWRKQPEFIRIIIDEKEQLISLDELSQQANFTLVCLSNDNFEEEYKISFKNKIPTIYRNEIKIFSSKLMEIISEGRMPTNFRWVDNKHFAVDFKKSEYIIRFNVDYCHNYIIEMPNDELIAFTTINLLGPYFTQIYIFNLKNKLVEWLIKFNKACNSYHYELDPSYFEKIITFFSEIRLRVNKDIKGLSNYLEILRQMPDLPDGLRPPQITLKEKMFELTPPTDQ